MSRIFLRNANLIDGDNPSRPADVVIEGERILEVIEAEGGAGAVPRPDDWVVDLGGRTVMPGMVLGHYHASYHKLGSVTAPFGLDAPPALQAARAAHNLRLTLDCGFTGVISAGAPHAIDAALKAAIAEGTVVGPRIMACGRDVSTTGHCNDLSYPSHMQIGAKGAMAICDGPEDFRRTVRQEMKDGAEIIKIFATGGHGVHVAAEQWQITPEELGMAIRTAAERNGKVRAHIANREAILCAIDLGIHILDHGDGFDEECIEAAVRRGTYLAPTLFFPKTVMRTAAGTAYAEGMREGYAQMMGILAKANDAGVRILIGDDYGAFGLDHGTYGEELAMYVEEAGIAPLDVIRWATVNGAAAMGLAHECGRVRAGMLADVIVVDGDPLADITVLGDPANVIAVFKGGTACKDGLDAVRQGIPTIGR